MKKGTKKHSTSRHQTRPPSSHHLHHSLTCFILLVEISTHFSHCPILSFSLSFSYLSLNLQQIFSVLNSIVIFPWPPFLLHTTTSSTMAALVLAVLIMAMTTGHSSATWCVCKDSLGDANLQKTLDYACGAGADCNPIHSNGPCYNPNNVRAHCNYAVNSYFQRKGQAQGSCDFAGTATVTASDPSSSGCTYPSSVSSAGTSTTPTTPVTTTTPSTTTPSTMNPSTNTPTSTTPSGLTTPTGVLGGVGTSLGPSGVGINTDYSEGYRIQGFSFTTTLLFSGLMLLRA